MLACMLVYVCIILEYGYFECLRVCLCMYVSCLSAAILDNAGLCVCLCMFVSCLSAAIGMLACVYACVCLFLRERGYWNACVYACVCLYHA